MLTKLYMCLSGFQQGKNKKKYKRDNHGKREDFVKTYYMQLHVPGGQVCDVKLSSVSLEGQMWAKAVLTEITTWCCSVWIQLLWVASSFEQIFVRIFKECHTWNPCCSGGPPNVVFQGLGILLRVSGRSGRGLPWQTQKQNPTDFSEARIWSLSYRYQFRF